MSSLLVVLNGIAIVCRSIEGNNMNREIVFMIASVLAAPYVSFDDLGRASCPTALTIRASAIPGKWRVRGSVVRADANHERRTR